MAFRIFLITLALTAIAIADTQHEIEAKTEAQKALAAEKFQKAKPIRSGFDEESYQEIRRKFNNTNTNRFRPRSKGNNLNIIHQMMRAEHADQKMLNDNEGVAVSEMVESNDTTLATKIKQLRKDGILRYEYINKNLVVPLVSGVYCNFENWKNASAVDMCMWQWNSTVSSHGLGFQVMTAEDVVRMNESSLGLKFNGPKTDADGNVEGKDIK